MQEKQAVRQFFTTYLTDAKIKEEIAERILKISQVFAKTHQQKEFIKMFYQQKSFITMGKRFLYIIHQLLERDKKKEMQEKYSSLISQSIVEYYLFFFTNIFKYSSLRDLIIDLKMYRMKWAKKITDDAFFKIRDVINDKFKFNIEKGFSEENLEKIKQLYQKRGFTKEQINKYLGLNTTNEITSRNFNSVQKKGYSSSDSSDESKSNNSSSPKKKIKPNQIVKQKINSQKFQTQPIKSPFLENHEKFSNGQQPQIYRYQASTHLYPLKNQLLYFPDYNYQKQSDYKSLNQEKPSSQQRQYLQKQIHKQTEIKNKEFEKNKVNQSCEPTHSYFNGIPAYIFHDKTLTKQDKNIQLLQKLRKNLISCRQCGILFQNQQNYDLHIEKHFFESLQKFNPQPMPKNNKQKEDRFKLLDINTWINNDKNQQSQFYFYVPIQKDLQSVKTCYFCNQPMQVFWNQLISKWAFKNCVKVLLKEKIRIMHHECYLVFQNESNSNQSAQLQNNKKKDFSH